MPRSMRRLPTLASVCLIGVAAALSVSAAKAVTTIPPRADIPTVWFTITTPTTSSTASVTIHWCDDVSLVSSSRYFTVNGAVVTTTYTTGSNAGCTAYATSSAT